MKVRQLPLIFAAREANNGNQREVNSCPERHKGHCLCLVRVQLVHFMHGRLACFCIQRHAGFLHNKTAHNVNKVAAEGGIVKISFVTSLCLWDGGLFCHLEETPLLIYETSLSVPPLHGIIFT